MMGKKKILILGAKGFSKVDCYDWNERNFPNIPDYDIVIINVLSLTRDLDERFVQSDIKDGLCDLLDSKGILFAIGSPRERITPFSEFNYSWCPVPIEIINKSGTSFKFEDATFKDYFKNVKKYPYCFEIADDSEDIKYFSYNSVKNRYGKYLACKIKYKKYRIIKKPISSTGYGGTKKILQEIHDSGDFYFLPCPTEINDKEAINFILENFLNIYKKTPPPEWTYLIEVPGLSKIQKNIETNLQKIKKISEKNSKLREKESDLTSYRELLYSTGTELEEIVKKVFTKLGYKPKPPKYKEEYIVVYDNKVGIIECKGNEKSIKRSDFRQLFENTKEYELDGKVEHKGILIGNAWRLKPLEEINKSGTPIFPKGRDGVIEISTKHDIALLSTIDLFKVFRKFLEGDIRADDIMKKIFSAKGVVDFNK